jgi:thymidylate kinase
MERPLKVVSIDGTRGAGKSSQIAMLSKHFKSLGLKVSTLKTTDGDPVQSGIVAMDFVDSFLSKNSDGIVIMDGSIARPMVADIITGMPTTTLLEKFKHLTHAYERINHKYGIVNFLIVMEDLEECEKRLEKFRSLTGQDSREIEANEQDVVSGMRFFNNHIASKNIQFQVLDIESHHSMNEIHKTIMEKLAEKYEFPKPKKDDNEW